MTRFLRQGTFLGPILAALVLGSGTGPLFADSLGGTLELTATRENRSFQDATGQDTDSQITSFYRRLTLDFNKTLWPNLTLQGGGLFEQRDDTLDPGDLKTSLWKTRPFLILRLRTPIYLVETGYNRNEEKQKSSGNLSTTLIREVYSATLGWQPVNFPQFKLQALRTNTYDRTRASRDTVEDFALLTSRYRPIQPLELFYRGTYQNTEDRIDRSEVRNTIHNARIIFSNAWWNRRLTLSSDYNVTRRETETRQEAGEIRFPVFPVAGLSSVDDTPEDGALDPNPALIDENLLASAGVNLGLPGVGGDARPRNLGLDLGTDNQVNTLLVWVDRELPQEIVQKFSYDIYTSPDNQQWTRYRQGVAPLWEPFLNRMEVQFDTVSTRFLKVAVRPLAPGGSSASFPDILVTELQAQIRRQADDIQGKTSSTNHIYNLNVRAKLLEAPVLYYELTYLLYKSGHNAAVTTLSNGLSFQHAFSKVYSVAGRVSREDGQQAEGDRRAFYYTTSFGATPLPTLRSTLQFSGKRETTAGKEDRFDSVYLFTGAELYQGIDATIGIGKTDTVAENGAKNESTLINAGASLVPHPALTFNLSLQSRSENIRGGGQGLDGKRTNRSTEGSLAFRPLPTVFLYASLRQEQRTGLARQWIRNVAASWSPFPDGGLRFNCRYDETYRSESATKERVIAPSVRWNIGPRLHLDLAFQRLTQETLQQKTTTDILSAIFRISF